MEAAAGSTLAADNTPEAKALTDTRMPAEAVMACRMPATNARSAAALAADILADAQLPAEKSEH